MIIDKKYNLLINVYLNEKEDITFYVPQPTEEEIQGVSKILGYFFKTISGGKEFIPVIIKDYKRLIDEAVDDSVHKDRIKEQMDNLFTRCIDSCSIIQDTAVYDYTTKEREKYLQDTYLVEKFKGTLLFILALFRYSERSAMEDSLMDFTTSLSITELALSLKKSVRGRSQEKTKEKKVSLTIS